MAKKKLSRLWIACHRGNKRKLKSMYNKFYAKSLVCRYKFTDINFSRINFRGSTFKNVKFIRSKFLGCDLWGVTFKNCKFINSLFSNSNLVGCVFINCKFDFSKFSSSDIVTTNITSYEECVEPSCYVTNDYPSLPHESFFLEKLEPLKNNKRLRLTKLVHISDKKLNNLNLRLLLNHYRREELVELLLELNSMPLGKINTYDSLRHALKRLWNKAKKKGSCPA